MLAGELAFCFFFNDTATTEIYTLSLHDALPIRALPERLSLRTPGSRYVPAGELVAIGPPHHPARRSEEHTSELQSRGHLVCRLLLEKKKKTQNNPSLQKKKKKKKKK